MSAPSRVPPHYAVAMELRRLISERMAGSEFLADDARRERRQITQASVDSIVAAHPDVTLGEIEQRRSA